MFSADGNGIVMRADALPLQTAKAAQSASPKLPNPCGGRVWRMLTPSSDATTTPLRFTPEQPREPVRRT